MSSILKRVASALLVVNGKRKNVTIGPGSKVSSAASFETEHGGSVTLGKNCEVSQGVIFKTYGGDIEVGDDCSFNPYCVIYGHGGLKIGNGVRVATHTVIIPANHTFELRDKFILEQPETRKGIVIDDDVWIGCGVRVLDGVYVAKGCIIAAGTILNRSTEPYGIYAGVPARLVKMRP